jgi:hypothetical protein
MILILDRMCRHPTGLLMIFPRKPERDSVVDGVPITKVKHRSGKDTFSQRETKTIRWIISWKLICLTQMCVCYS